MTIDKLVARYEICTSTITINIEVASRWASSGPLDYIFIIIVTDLHTYTAENKTIVVEVPKIGTCAVVALKFDCGPH